MDSNDSQDFYVTPTSTLSQGDIVRRVPWGLIEAPVTICRANNRQATAGKAYFAPADQIQKPAGWQRDPEVLHATGWSGEAIVAWHDCQIDKFKNQGRAVEKSFAAIAPILPLDTIPQQLRAAVEAGEHFSYFPLLPFSFGNVTFPASYVDLRHIWSVRQSLLIERIVSLSQIVRLDFYRHLFTFLTRWRVIEDAPCPHCGRLIALSNLVEKVEAPDAE